MAVLLTVWLVGTFLTWPCIYVLSAHLDIPVPCFFLLIVQGWMASADNYPNTVVITIVTGCLSVTNIANAIDWKKGKLGFILKKSFYCWISSVNKFLKYGSFAFSWANQITVLFVDATGSSNRLLQLNWLNWIHMTSAALNCCMSHANSPLLTMYMNYVLDILVY